MNAIDIANAAIRLKDNDDFKDIMRLIEADIFEAFKNTKIGEVDELQNVHQLSHGFKLINQRIDKYIEIASFEQRKEENY